MEQINVDKDCGSCGTDEYILDDVEQLLAQMRAIV